MKKSGLIDRIREQARAKSKKKVLRVILTEPEDPRVLEAACIAADERLAKIILLGNPKEILEDAKKKKLSLDLKSIEIVDYKRSADKERYANMLFELRKEKGLKLPDAKKLIEDCMYFAVMMLKDGKADGIVSGAIHPTAHTLKPALQVIKAKSGFASSFFLMICTLARQESIFVFADCGVNVNPDAGQLAMIAMQSAESFAAFVSDYENDEPRVALLSFSTHGSGGEDPSIKKVRDALAIVNKTNKKLTIEGEVQVDEAIVKSVADLKCPTCRVKGDANVLIFPDLNAGNIGYKLVERFGNATAIGPIMQGLNMPVNDLSRGCKTSDIVDMVAITVLQTGK